MSITNVKPKPSAAPDQTASEGVSASFALGTFSDPGPDSPWQVLVDWGDSTPAESFSATSSGALPSRAHQYADNGPIGVAYVVTVTVTDKDGGADSASFKVAVANTPPALAAIAVSPTEPAQVGTSVNATVTFTGSGAKDTHAAVWAWGDGTTSTGVVAEANGAGSVRRAHSYSAAGVYSVAVTVTDDDGGTAATDLDFVVIYDPTGGFVTGGGWIVSPPGACQLTSVCQNASGKANFGFESKYQKGASVPSGRTEFQFQDGSLNFHSQTYNWLVIAGARAQYKGSGTINGSGDHTFLLTAREGQVSGGGGVDRFRIKIVDRTTGAVVYDNQMGASETGDAGTALGGGSIVVHQ